MKKLIQSKMNLTLVSGFLLGILFIVACSSAGSDDTPTRSDVDPLYVYDGEGTKLGTFLRRKLISSSDTPSLISALMSALVRLDPDGAMTFVNRNTDRLRVFFQGCEESLGLLLVQSYPDQFGGT